MDIKGKVFIVTGAASGLGEGTARALAAKGGIVVIADMQADKGEAVAKDIGGAFVKCDVSSEADGQAVVAKAVSLGKLMGLVNCAGVAPAEKTVGKNGAHALASFSKTITINLIGSFNMIRLAADAMCKNEPEATGERGAMISTASVAAYDGQIGQAAYSASKGGIVGMTLPIARDLARRIDYPHVEEAYLAGLLHNVGRLALLATARSAWPSATRGVGCSSRRRACANNAGGSASAPRSASNASRASPSVPLT